VRFRHALSDHLRLEVAHAVHAGHRPGDAPPLESGEPVPGCGCVLCRALADGANGLGADLVPTVLSDLAGASPGARPKLARTWADAWPVDGAILPDPEWLLSELERRERAERRREEARKSREEDDPLPVEEARRVPIESVVRRLGLGEPEGRWGEPRVLCPLHDDSNPSLRLREPEGLVYCDPCGQGGDGIWLVMEALGLEFADAVLWLVEGGVRDPGDHLQRRVAV